MLFESKINAIVPHNKNTPMNPAKKDFHGAIGISAQATKAAKATVHHGKYNPAVKLNNAVNNIAEINLILIYDL